MSGEVYSIVFGLAVTYIATKKKNDNNLITAAKSIVLCFALLIVTYDFMVRLFNYLLIPEKIENYNVWHTLFYDFTPNKIGVFISIIYFLLSFLILSLSVRLPRSDKGYEDGLVYSKVNFELLNFFSKRAKFKRIDKVKAFNEIINLISCIYAIYVMCIQLAVQARADINSFLMGNSTFMYVYIMGLMACLLAIFIAAVSLVIDSLKR